jgi:hypothetical protein
MGLGNGDRNHPKRNQLAAIDYSVHGLNRMDVSRPRYRRALFRAHR